MQRRWEEGALHPTLSWVSKIRFVIEDVIDAIHQQVVGDEEKHKAHHQYLINTFGEDVIRKAKRKSRINPTQGT